MAQNDQQKQQPVSATQQSIDQAKELDELNEADQKAKRKAVLAKDKVNLDAIDKFTETLIEPLKEATKNLDAAFEAAGGSSRFRKIDYVEREEDEELKAMFEKERARLDKLQDRMYGKIDGEIDLDLHGNIQVREAGKKNEEVPEAQEKKGGIDDAGTYILRDGKLVKGKAEIREQAQFSNWYCSNADPEDIRRHRELMDRMHYRGPQWENIGIPKSIIEEENPVYKMRDPEDHPMISHPEEEGKKEFEHVVR